MSDPRDAFDYPQDYRAWIRDGKPQPGDDIDVLLGSLRGEANRDMLADDDWP